MILAYPYFRRGNMIYYVYKREEDNLSILAWNMQTEDFQAFKRTIKDHKVTLTYRPKRVMVHMNTLQEVEE